MTNPTQPIHNKRQHAPTQIGQLLNRYAITLEQVKQCLVEEGVKFNSRSTLHRLVHGKISQEMKAELHPKVAKCLNKFLLARGLEKAEIDKQLLSIFDEGEYQPMISQRLELDAEECRFFKFLGPDGKPVDPYTRTPESLEEVFVTPPFQKIIDRVVDAIRYQNFVCVSGEIGSGKSTLRALMEYYVATQPGLHLVWPEFFDMRNITPMQIAEAILSELGVQRIPHSSVKRGREVKNQLSALYQQGKRVAIAFDECHKLSDQAISSLKNFLEMSSGGFQRYLGVILFGQPLIESRLRDPRFREIFERIVVIHMPGAETEDAEKKKIASFSDYAPDYLAHRLKHVGRKVEDVFDAEAIKLICRQATTPLSLGNIANAALRISKKKFQNHKVIGAAIKSEPLFENQREPQFKRRGA